MSKDSEYSSYRDGKFVTVPPIDTLCLQLKDKFLRQQERLDFLNEENKKLKEGIWKEEEVARLKREHDEMKEDFYRGFPISKEEHEAIKEWQKIHECTCRNSRLFGITSYTFHPTALGVAAVAKCGCGKEFRFREIG